MTPVRVSVVGAALLRGDRVLASRRTSPPRLAGFWEFPGGKVEEGETDQQALVRELQEELGCVAAIGERIGPDLLIGDTAVMRVYLATLVSGEPQLRDHDAHRWLSAAELDDVRWIPVDAPVLPPLRAQLLGIKRTGASGGADSREPR
ncbi:MAG: (deoxy)nucleoside triphosphate pyrophosphohydrolase [Frankiales bacterium]|nr:(deoxy)nucleoside triphosphate pyrophosphohydrolase [Frankiales bacterium]